MRLSLHFATFRPTRLSVGGTLAMIGFFDFVAWFGHVSIPLVERFEGYFSECSRNHTCFLIVWKVAFDGVANDTPQQNSKAVLYAAISDFGPKLRKPINCFAPQRFEG